MINKEIKEKYPSVKFDELERFIPKYKQRYYYRLLPKWQEYARLIGHKGISFLLLSLQRSKSLFTGFIDCINTSNVVLAYLSTRAHLESTGSIAYSLSCLQKFYNNEISLNKIEETFSKLATSVRTLPNSDNFHKFPEPINVLTLIDTVDKLFKDNKGKNLKIFRKCYDFLSEYCHPNMPGLLVGSHVTDDFELVIYEKSMFQDADFVILINYMIISCTYFFDIYDRSFTLLKENEQIPDLIKPNN